MVFENGVKNIQAVAYNGARTVPYLITKFICPRDGINGMVQGCMVPGLSGILVIGQKTREVFRGGDRSNKINYDTVPVPELKIITPLDSANAFSRVLQQCFRQSPF